MQKRKCEERNSGEMIKEDFSKVYRKKSHKII